MFRRRARALPSPAAGRDVSTVLRVRVRSTGAHWARVRARRAASSERVHSRHRPRPLLGVRGAGRVEVDQGRLQATCSTPSRDACSHRWHVRNVVSAASEMVRSSSLPTPMIPEASVALRIVVVTPHCVTCSLALKQPRRDHLRREGLAGHLGEVRTVICSYKTTSEPRRQLRSPTIYI